MNFMRVICKQIAAGRTLQNTARLVTQRQTLFRPISISSRLGVQRLLQTLQKPEIKSALLEKRATRKTAPNEIKTDLSALGFFNVSAFATAEEYNLESLFDGLTKQGLYKTQRFFSTDNLGGEQDVLYATAQYPVGQETHAVFFFREGCVIMWNFNEIETNNMLAFLKPYEKDAYLKPLVRVESEIMPYTYIETQPLEQQRNDAINGTTTRAFFQKGKFYLTKGEDNFLEKYTFSNAMATSIKLGIWEATLERYITSMQYLTDDLKRGRKIRITRRDLLRKTGELFALRHGINLSSDLLDTPDFYWDREELETLYLQVCSYFSISRRTKVVNEKISHCLALAELISDNLNDAHHIRLEWMIIVLIMVEVAFEIVHYMERYYANDTEFAVPLMAVEKQIDQTLKPLAQNC